MAREKGMGNLQREKSGRWTMRVGINGKRYCRSTRTKDRDQAERVLQRFLAPFGLGEHRLPLADVWMEYLKSPNRNELAQATLNGKRNTWMQFAKWMEHFYLPVKDLGGITSDMIAEYLACVRTEVCASTYNTRVCILREIFRTLAKKAGLEEDPWEGVRLRPDDSHSRRELTMEELKRLLDAAKKVGSPSCASLTSGKDSASPLFCASLTSGKDSASPLFCASLTSGKDSASPLFCASLTSGKDSASPLNEWYKLMLIGIYTGLRLGDCCRLDWSQISIAQGVIQLVPRKTRRHHQRLVTIPIHPALGRALISGEAESFPLQDKDGSLHSEAEGIPAGLRLLHAQSLRSGPVLPMIAEMYAHSRWQVSHELSRIFRAANIQTSVRLEGRHRRTPEATFHSLRHTFVSFAANAGVPLHIVQSIVGHESTAMTRHYYHENFDALKSAVAAIPTL